MRITRHNFLTSRAIAECLLFPVSVYFLVSTYVVALKTRSEKSFVFSQVALLQSIGVCQSPSTKG